MFKRLTGLWRRPDFMKLWTGQTISNFGSHVGGGALRFTAILILSATPVQLGLLAAAAMAPALLLGLPAGVWVDRLRRRPILIAADLGRALLLFSIPLAYAFDMLRIEQLYLVAALAGALAIFFDLAYQAFLPSVVRREELVEGNSKLGISDSVAEIAGPPLGGALVQIVSAPFAILVDAISFLCSALTISRIRSPEPTPAQPTPHQRVWREIGEGLRVVRDHPLLRALLIGGVTLSLSGGIIGTLYDLYLIRELGMSPAIVGIAIGVGGCGALLGAFVTRSIVARFGVGPALAGALVMSGATGLLLPLAHGPLTITLPMILLGQFTDVAFAVYFINEISLRQALTPDRSLGRVNASFRFLTTAAGLIGTLLGGVLGQTLGTRAAIAFGVAGVLLAGAYLVRSPIRSVREAPVDPLHIQPTGVQAA